MIYLAVVGSRRLGLLQATFVVLAASSLVGDAQAGVHFLLFLGPCISSTSLARYARQQPPPPSSSAPLFAYAAVLSGPGLGLLFGLGLLCGLSGFLLTMAVLTIALIVIAATATAIVTVVIAVATA